MTRTTLERIPNHPLRWNLADLEIGDEIFVPKKVSTFNRVYSYVKPRSYTLGINLVVERDEHGTVVRRTAEEEVSGRQAMKRPGQDWGWIEKPPGRKTFRWPFGSMELGDFFIVAKEDIRHDAIGRAAANAGWGLRQHFRVNAEHPDYPGFYHVQRVAESRVGWEAANYGTARTRVEDAYLAPDETHRIDWNDRMNLDKMPWANLKIGERIHTKAKMIHKPPRNFYIFAAPSLIDGEMARYALEMYPEAIEIERVPDDMTQQQYEEQRARRLRDLID